MSQTDDTNAIPEGQTFRLADILATRMQQNRAYLEFLRVPSLSVGLYSLPAGGVDPQKPHTEDEIYYIVSGRASVLVGEQDMAVEAGSVVYVKAGIEHHFHSIAEDLDLLVFFAPAEYTLACPSDEQSPRAG